MRVLYREFPDLWTQLRRWDDIEALDYEGAQIGAITHGHALGYMPCAVLTHIVNRLVYPKKPGMVLVNAWNEYTEGSYLMPDEKNGDAYLKALKAAVRKGSFENKSKDTKEKRQ